jgi:hypothetical protein
LSPSSVIAIARGDVPKLLKSMVVISVGGFAFASKTWMLFDDELAT